MVLDDRTQPLQPVVSWADRHGPHWLTAAVALLLCSCAAPPDLASARPAATAATAVAANAPAVPASADILAVANRAADWQLAHMSDIASFVRHSTPQTDKPRGWVQGTFFLGLADFAEATGQRRYLAALGDIATGEGWRLGDRTYHADDHLVGQLYVRLHRAGVASADLRPMAGSLAQILATRPAGPLQHPEARTDPPCADRWCWADALFMAPATWWEAATALDRPEYRTFADEEFRAITALIFDRDEGLYFRDSRFLDQRGPDGEKLFWSRGNGWVYAGLVNILRAMPADDPRRGYYLALYRQMSERLVSIQAENGMWRSSLLAASTMPPETSGTGFFVYGLAWGVNQGVLSGARYRDAAGRGWQALAAQVNGDGRLGYVQQIGDRPEDVRVDDSQFYGVGAFLLAAGQMLDLSRK